MSSSRERKLERRGKKANADGRGTLGVKKKAGRRRSIGK